jgi:hypothetical protein
MDLSLYYFLGAHKGKSRFKDVECQILDSVGK